MDTKMISIANEFSATPSGRYKEDSNSSGERFREEFLVPGLENNDNLIIDLDGAMGYGSSFLEEAFGGLVRIHDYKAADLLRRIKINTQYDTYKKKIERYINEARFTRK